MTLLGPCLIRSPLGRTVLALVIMAIIGASVVGRSQAEVSVRHKTELVSRASDGKVGNLPSFDPGVTGDGRSVYFTSYATNFTPSQPARGLRLFRREMRTGQTTPVPTEGTGPGSPVVSANGRFLAYLSSIDYSDDGGHSEIFVRNLQTGRTVLASRADGVAGAPAAAPPRYEYLPSVARPSLSANGRYLAFVSTAPNLYPGTWHRRVSAQIYVRDLVTGTTTLISRASGRRGRLADAPCAEPEISADGGSVAFTSSAGNLAPVAARGAAFDGNVFVRDLAAAKTTAVSRTRVTTASYAPVISADGRYVAFFRKGPHVATQVFERDIQTAKTVLVSRAAGKSGAPADSFVSKSFLAISPDGGLVAFFSNATNLGGPPPPDGSGGNFGLYLRDLGARSTTFVHWEGWGRPRFAAGGRYLLFGTFDTDQPSPNGAFASGQIYRYDRGPSDG
jgi:hypothetical protein